jgi:hypothetical protein
MLVSLVAILVALVAGETQAGFIRPRSTASPGIYAGLLGAAEVAEDVVALPAGLRPFDGTGAQPTTNDESDDWPGFRTCWGGLAGSDGACGDVPSSQSAGAGSNSVAIHSVAWSLPEQTLLARLPGEMGPCFSNPPPWTPLRPPCSSKSVSV